ncbi:unnamed protein product [Aspergillus oryzae var. brunneus]|uniref:Unnamed protein product n=2 Tax=Aspergillus oryzae TaxID=5062 RepID=A0AAN4YH42_ASPOZ|nr:unnamed protein product [Aspergillus oryzae]GMG49713.1 unnamed protein product [Aspergillus oryzae var. brunneus]
MAKLALKVEIGEFFIETPDAGGQDGDSGSEDEDDIEAQIRKEVAGLKPSSAKPRQFQAIRLDIPCGL